MSKCISRYGEYSEHVLEGEGYMRFMCQRCFAFDEDAALAELARKDKVLADIAALHVEPHPEMDETVWDAYYDTRRILASLTEPKDGNDER